MKIDRILRPTFLCLVLLSSAAGFAEEFPKGVREPVEFSRTPLILSCNAANDESAPAESAVFDVSFSRDGQLMASGNSQGHVVVRKVGDPQIMHRFVGEHLTPIRHVRFIDNDRLLASLDLDGRVIVWSLDAGKMIKELETPDAILALGVGQDTRRLIGLSDKPALQTWAFDDDQTLVADQTRKLSDDFRLLSVSENSGELILATSDSWQVWSLPELRMSKSESIAPAVISSIRMSPAGKRFALGMQDGGVRVCQTTDGKQLHAWKKHPNAVTCLAFSHSGETLLSGCLRDRIRVWDLQTGQHVNDRDVGLDLVTSLELSRDDQHLSVGGMGDDVAYFDVQQAAKTYIPAISWPKGWNGKAMHAVRFLRHSNEIATVAKYGTVERLDLLGERIEKGGEIEPGNDRLKTATISPDGSLSAHAYQSGAVRVYESNGARARHVFAMTRGADAIDFSPDSQRLVIAAGRDATLTMMDVATGKVIWDRPTIGQHVQRIIFADDGKNVLTVGHSRDINGHVGTLTRWSSESGEAVAAISSPTIYSCIGVSPKGTRIVTGGITGRMCVFDETLQQVNLVDVGGRGGIHAFCWMDERRVLVGTYKGSVLMVDADSSAELARLEPLPVHRLMPIRCIDYWPEKKLVAAVGGYDSAETMRIYRLDE